MPLLVALSLQAALSSCSHAAARWLHAAAHRRLARRRSTADCTPPLAGCSSPAAGTLASRTRFYTYTFESRIEMINPINVKSEASWLRYLRFVSDPYNNKWASIRSLVADGE